MKEKFNTIGRSVLAEQVANEILRLVASGDLQPGDALPSERELSRLLGVGRPAVREALRALHILGIIEVRQGQETRIIDITPAQMVRPLQLLLGLRSLDIDYLFEARMVLEPPIAELAAERLDPDQVAELAELLETSQGAVDDPKLFMAIDTKIHHVIVQAAQNPVLEFLVLGVAQLLRQSREQTVALTRLREETVTDHTEIVHALRQRNGPATRRAMEQHLRRVHAAYKANLERSSPGNGIPSPTTITTREDTWE